MGVVGADITGLQAENILKSRGIHGSFLARPSRKNTGDFSLSVRVGEIVTHIRIQNTGDYYDLYGGEKFATLTELVDYYTAENGILQDKDGTIIELKYPLNCSDPTTERWYHGHLSGSNAEKLLVVRDEPFTFLVRESLSTPGDFVLSVLTDTIGKTGTKRVSHIKIMCQVCNDRYTVGGEDMFDTLTDLVEYYKRTGIEEISGNWVYFRQPYYSTRVNAGDIGSRVKQLDQTTQKQLEGESEKSKAGFWEEFDALQKQEAKVKKSREEGQRPENKSKNRYKNILPFNDTRVILKNADPNVVGSDYINANYLRNTLWESTSQKVYIASQGCLASTVSDFWQMVWQENTRVIVMTTREVEKGRNKCVPYWPDSEGPKDVGQYVVTINSEREASDYKVRVLKMCPPQNSRIIWHYQYISWPDHGVPEEPGGVLSFLAQVNAKQDEFAKAGPMIIHCSAGIGRTGTIVVIDMILETINTLGLDCDIDISKYIQMVREQRSGMVQTEAQYKFIYLAVADYIQATKAKDYASMVSSAETLSGATVEKFGCECGLSGQRGFPPLTTASQAAAADLSASEMNVDPETETVVQTKCVWVCVCGGWGGGGGCAGWNHPVSISDVALSFLRQETDTEYGNLQLKHPAVGRQTSK
uniref:Tyrosine-protein phosphatase non-receptor type n=1 Tax=Takifugu rubripes TaxID=31033 RepID=A0A674MCD8_TAKRU